MQLQHFLPYRIAQLADAISHALAALYGERFGLSRDEWRVLAALGETTPMKATEIAAGSALDKMQISRALARMEQSGLIERESDSSDRRNRIVHLRPAGRALYKQLAPMLQARERFMLDALDARERKVLDGALAKLLQRAQQLRDQG